MERVKQNLFSEVEKSVLKWLCVRSGLSTDLESGNLSGMDLDNLELTEIEPSEIADIAIASGIKDNDEVLRALYNLEGKSMAEPYPVGDFTSQRWRVTPTGVKAFALIRREEEQETLKALASQSPAAKFFSARENPNPVPAASRPSKRAVNY